MGVVSVNASITSLKEEQMLIASSGSVLVIIFVLYRVVLTFRGGFKDAAGLHLRLNLLPCSDVHLWIMLAATSSLQCEERLDETSMCSVARSVGVVDGRSGVCHRWRVFPLSQVPREDKAGTGYVEKALRHSVAKKRTVRRNRYTEALARPRSGGGGSVPVNVTSYRLQPMLATSPANWCPRSSWLDHSWIFYRYFIDLFQSPRYCGCTYLSVEDLTCGYFRLSDLCCTNTSAALTGQLRNDLQETFR